MNVKNKFVTLIAKENRANVSTSHLHWIIILADPINNIEAQLAISKAIPDDIFNLNSENAPEESFDFEKYIPLFHALHISELNTSAAISAKQIR